MSAGAYALLRFADTEKLLPAIDVLSSIDGVDQWHAVDGHYHLVLKISRPSPALEDALAGLDGLERSELCAVAEENGTFTADPDSTAAYVFVDVDTAARDAVAEAMGADGSGLVRLAQTDCGVIGILQKSSFEEVDHFVNGSLRSLDGVLRVKRDWIIDLTQL